MTDRLVDLRDQRFVLHEMLEVGRLCASPRFADHSAESFDLVLETARRLAMTDIWPTYLAGDHAGGARLEGGRAVVPDCFREPYRKLVEGGWLMLDGLPEYGGQGMPLAATVAALEWFMAANPALFFLAYGGVAAGRLVQNFGDERQKRLYMRPLYEGRFGGTMCLTEPQAGSDVGALRTTATRLPDGRFKIRGTKIFITNGDQNLHENIIHPVLARIEGDPPGTKGISIFLVPRLRVNEDGSPGAFNDVVTGNVEKKMGLSASPTCLLHFGENDDCIGELLGPERAGMRIMFQMMNEARIGVGLQGLAHASAAYGHARAYAAERLQGAAVEQFADPTAPRVPILRHPDVRRMLLFMKSAAEGMRALVYYAASCEDRGHVDEADAAVAWRDRLELLTPIVKAYCADLGFRVCEVGMQVFGGYGFCLEYPIQQFLRDCKIASIYEGANGIQAIDLVARKLGRRGGQVLAGFLSDIAEAAARCAKGPLAREAAILARGQEALGGVAMHLLASFQEGKLRETLLEASPVLELMGDVTLGWLLLRQAEIAAARLETLAPGAEGAALEELCERNPEVAFYVGKLAAARFFLGRVTALAPAKAEVIRSGEGSAVRISDAAL